MVMILVPGYRELFGEPDRSYAERVEGIPSYIIINVMIALNNELNAPLEEVQNQQRLRNIIAHRFTDEQRKQLEDAYRKYRIRSNGTYQDYVFGRRYMIAVILKELNNFRDVADYQETPQHEFDLLMAYLQTIDEVNQQDQELYEEANQHEDDLKEYRMMWTPNIGQYEFNEDSNVVFELLRLFVFMKYALDKHRAYLRAYISKFDFDNISRFVGSIHQISVTTLDYHNNEVFKKLNWINPGEGIIPLHLEGWSINRLIGKKITIDSIRRLPLFASEGNRFLVIDEAIYNKKPYKGPFFELFYETGLKDTVSFEAYCSDVATEVLEQRLFQGIVKQLQPKKHDVLYFDDATDSVPDAYYRHNKSIVLMEFKGYLFPAHLSDDPSFEKIKTYIDHRFVANEGGHAKGVGQIINQIRHLKNLQYQFDMVYNEKLTTKKPDVYPAIIHTEFQLTMPGINAYLNKVFLEKIDDELREAFVIHPVTFISLETLFDFAIRRGSFEQLYELFERYHKILENRQRLFEKNPTTDNYLKSKSSFDEIYRTIFRPELKEMSDISVVQKIAGITQEELDAPL